MSGLLAYSGITTKIRAMESHFLSNSDYREMASLETVPEAVEYLKRFPSYGEIFAGLEESRLHRGDIEQRLTLSQYHAFAKLYRFSNLSQRKFLDLYFMHYEIILLKNCLRNALDHRKFDLDLSMFQDFFDSHSKLDLIKLSTSENLQEFISNLDDSPYYDLLAHLSDTSAPTLFDYEMHLDLLYFKTIWKMKNHLLSRNEQKILSQCFGSRLDMLNIQWIYRSKKYYRLSAADIYSLLIPIEYRLKKEDVVKMAESGNVDEFYAALQSTYYGALNLTEPGEKQNLEWMAEEVLNRCYRITRQRNPYSIASLNSYLHFKEQEIHKIITVIESIRYGINADTICSYVIKKQ